ncbi:MAG: PrgI family protein [Actinobacteria bacterium]|nr:PrgI family protein [Actinomycetota bacterium]
MRSKTARQLIWYLGVAALAFALPFVGTSVLDLDHDVYLALYMPVIVIAIWWYARSTEVDLRETFRRRLALSIALGVLVSAFLVVNVLSEESTSRPDGVYFAFELIWRGAFYGAVDALLLTVFPCMVVFALLREDLTGARRKSAFVALSLVLILVLTAVYHLGYEQYRDDGVKAPEIGNTIISIPMLATVNPAGSLVAHSTMHVAAVVHEYETEVRLPPATDAD